MPVIGFLSACPVYPQRRTYLVTACMAVECHDGPQPAEIPHHNEPVTRSSPIRYVFFSAPQRFTGRSGQPSFLLRCGPAGPISRIWRRATTELVDRARHETPWNVAKLFLQPKITTLIQRWREHATSRSSLARRRPHFRNRRQEEVSQICRHELRIDRRKLLLKSVDLPSTASNGLKPSAISLPKGSQWPKSAPAPICLHGSQFTPG